MKAMKKTIAPVTSCRPAWPPRSLPRVNTQAGRELCDCARVLRTLGTSEVDIAKTITALMKQMAAPEGMRGLRGLNKPMV